MSLMSENIVDYISLNYDENVINKLEEVDNLVINKYNYSLETASFFPNELSYFKNLNSCTFMNFEITDEILANLRETNIRELILDNCICKNTLDFNIESLVLDMTNADLKQIKDAKRLALIECGKIDIQDICNNSIEELKIIDCDIVNSSMLSKFSDADIELIGCRLDDYSVIDLENIFYDRNKYKKYIEISE